MIKFETGERMNQLQRCHVGKRLGTHSGGTALKSLSLSLTLSVENAGIFGAAFLSFLSFLLIFVVFLLCLLFCNKEAVMTGPRAHFPLECRKEKPLLTTTPLSFSFFIIIITINIIIVTIFSSTRLPAAELNYIFFFKFI